MIILDITKSEFGNIYRLIIHYLIATVRPQSENDLEVVEKETQEGEGDASEEEEEEACNATPVEASAEEEAAAVASTIIKVFQTLNMISY